MLCGHETYPAALRGEHSLRVFENRVLKNICLPKREDVTGNWRKLHIEELPILPSHWILLNVSTRM